MRMFPSLCRSSASVTLLLGILFVLASLPAPVDAGDATPGPSWAELMAEREGLGKQFLGLVAAGTTDEALAVVEKLIAADRRILSLQAASDAEKKTQQDARLEAIKKLQWLVNQKAGREEWAAAAARQRELADILDTYLGNSHYRAIDAHHEQTYLERLASLKGEEARELVKADGNLAKVAELYERGKYGEAIPLAREAIKVQQRLLGNSSPKLAIGLSWLGCLHYSQGDYVRAEPLWHQALEIRKKALGENHPLHAQSLNNLAALYESQGDYAQAELLCRQVPGIYKTALGENHPDYASSLNNLAALYKAQGDYARAEPLVRQAVTIQFNHLEDTAVIQSERQQLAMLVSVRFYLNHYLALAAQRDRFSTSAYQQMLAWKGMVFRRERLARAGEQTPELAALFRQLQQVAGQLASQAWATPDPKQLAGWRENVDRLSAEKERLEAELSAQRRHIARPRSRSRWKTSSRPCPKIRPWSIF